MQLNFKNIIFSTLIFSGILFFSLNISKLNIGNKKLNFINNYDEIIIKNNQKKVESIKEKIEPQIIKEINAKKLDKNLKDIVIKVFLNR